MCDDPSDGAREDPIEDPSLDLESELETLSFHGSPHEAGGSPRAAALVDAGEPAQPLSWGEYKASTVPVCAELQNMITVGSAWFIKIRDMQYTQKLAEDLSVFNLELGIFLSRLTDIQASPEVTDYRGAYENMMMNMETVTKTYADFKQAIQPTEDNEVIEDEVMADLESESD